MSHIASPLALRSGVALPNRLAKAAMSESLAAASGAPTDELVRLYERWGRSGAGMLITGHVIVDPGGQAEPGNVVVYDDRHLAALRRWVQAGQARGARMWMQVNHAGRQSTRRTSRQPVAPSVVPMRGMSAAFSPPRALTEREIRRIIGRFATAAAIAKDAGFFGVELHGAHGYLVSQFLSPRTNHRQDEWGGDLAGRSRFLFEVVAAMRGAVGVSFPIAVKLNSADFQRGGFTIDDAMTVARQLDEAGIDLLEISGGNYESPAMAGSGELATEQRASSQAREAYFLDYARRIRGVTRVPIMLTGGMRSRAVMDDALASGTVDVIGMARPMAHTPDLPRRLLDGSLAAAPTPAVALRSRVRLVDDLLQVFWFQAQIHAMAKGRDPNPKLSKWSALWHTVTTNLSGASA